MSRELKSTDTGAPQLAGVSKGSLIAVLKAALVNGYGSTAPLGWDIAYEDTVQNICVFRPRVGSRMFLQIIENWDSGYDGCIASSISYESMTGPDLGFSPMPSAESTYAGIVKTYNANTNAAKWHIIGDERGFYFLSYFHSSGTNTALHCMAKLHYYGEGILLGDTEFTSKYNWVQASNKRGAWEQALPKIYCMRNPISQRRGVSTEWDCRNVLTTFSTSAATIGRRNETRAANKIIYTPCVFVNYNKMFNMSLPGLFEPSLPSATDYMKGENFYEEIDENNKIYTFTIATSTDANINGNNRLSILIGDKFRDVF